MKKFLILTVFIHSLLLISCSKKDPEVIDFNKKFISNSGGSLINAMIGEPSNLIAMIAGDSASSAIAGNIFNSLIKYDENLEYAPDLAESWQISNNQKTITFKLKKGLKWQDGKPLTSSDVLFTWKLITNPNTRTPYASDYQLVIKAEAPNPLTFQITYADSYAPALDTWASLHILPKHILENEDINNTFFSRNPIGSSYYKLDNWISGQQVTLNANENSISGPPLIKKLTSRIIPDSSSQFLELTADNIDLMNINPIQYQRVFPAKKDLQSKIELYKEFGNGYTNTYTSTVNDSYKGEWEWENNKEELEIEYDNYTQEFEILKLTNKELTLDNFL